MSRAVGLYLVCAVVIAACGNGSPDPGDDQALPAQVWEQLAQSPLSARAAALGVWTGSEVLVMGGEPRAWCPPNADCIERDFAQLADGAAFDPITGSWRSIASSPLPLAGYVSAVVVKDALYVLAHPTGRPEGDGGFCDICSRKITGRICLLRQRSAGTGWWGRPTPSSFSPGQTRWKREPILSSIRLPRPGPELPRDPLSPSFGRDMAVMADGLYLFADDLVANPGSVEPSLARVARLDLLTGEWERRADSEILGTWKSVTSGSSIIFPWSGEADGGEVNNWARSYPYGGIYDTRTDSWSLLPEPSREGTFEVAGVLGSDRAAYLSAAGSVLELAQRTWITIPELPAADAFNRTVVAAGTDLFVFGGEIWPTSATGSLLDDAYLWRPVP